MAKAPHPSADPARAATGRCLCGGVKFEVLGPLRPVTYCHCGMCRRTSGHFVAASACDRGHLRMLATDGLTWYQSSASARRGFCGRCGSQLFWDPVDGADISLFAGAIDLPSGLTAAEHIFVADKGDYYEILDGLPQKRGWD